MKTVKGVRGEPGSRSQKSGKLERNRFISPAGERKMSSSTAGGYDNADSECKDERTGQESVRSHMVKINIKEGEEEEAAGGGSKRTQDESQVNGTKNVFFEDTNNGWGRVRDGSQETHIIEPS